MHLGLKKWVVSPKRAMQLNINARAQNAAEVSIMGIASGHLVDLSTIVNRCVYPCDGGR